MPNGQPEQTDTNAKPIVFYDGGCPLCSREIGHYRRLDRQACIEWVDITRQPEILERHGLTRQRAMHRLHVLDSTRRWRTGSQGFALIWSRLPGYRRLGAMLSRVGAMPLLESLYERFANWRRKRRS
jgi:predicted DCC family thiol-disulfide oxidoreductase YuxK